MDIELKRHTRSFASVHATWLRNPEQWVTLARWYNGNPIHNSIYELDPDEAEKLAGLLRSHAAECKAPLEEREAFEAYREAAIEADGPGSAKLFLDWKRRGPAEQVVVALTMAQAKWLLVKMEVEKRWDSEQPMTADIAAMLEDIIVNEHGEE